MPELDQPVTRVGRDVAPAPAVSVVVPAYNTARYIAEALDSLLAQTFTDYECLVVNDGSPDTPELERALAPYLERVVYIRQGNRGLSGARNTAIRAARAPLIALLDSDDVWEPDYLAAQVALIGRDPSVDVLYPNAVFFGDTPDAGREFMKLYPSRGEATFEALLTRRCNVFGGVVARREAIVGAGMYDEELGNRIPEDLDLWLRIARRGGRIAYHDRVLVRYRRHGSSLTSDPVQTLGKVLLMLEKLTRDLPLSEGERRLCEREAARVHADLRLREGKRAFFRGDIPAAVEGLTEANAVFRSRRTALVLWLLRRAPRALQLLYNLRDRFILRADTKF